MMIIKDENGQVVIETTISEEFEDIMEERNISESKIKEQINRFYEKAKKIITDKEKVSELLSKAERLCGKLSRIPIVGGEFDNISALCSMIKEYIYKTYTRIPKNTIIVFLAAIMYFLSPIDLIPDFIPLIGYADDMLIFSFITEAAKSDIKAYKKWKEEQKQKENGV